MGRGESIRADVSDLVVVNLVAAKDVARVSQPPLPEQLVGLPMFGG